MPRHHWRAALDFCVTNSFVGNLSARIIPIRCRYKYGKSLLKSRVIFCLAALVTLLARRFCHGAQQVQVASLIVDWSQNCPESLQPSEHSKCVATSLTESASFSLKPGAPSFFCATFHILTRVLQSSLGAPCRLPEIWSGSIRDEK